MTATSPLFWGLLVLLGSDPDKYLLLKFNRFNNTFAKFQIG